MRSTDPDDIDARFEELVARFHEDGAEFTREPARPSPASSSPLAGRGLTPIVVIVLFALVVAVGLVVNLRPGLLGLTDQVPLVRPSQAPVSRPAGQAGPAQLTLPSAVFYDAFADSKAAAYANGVSGVVMPRAKALGGLSKKEVKTALKRARDLLIAANLDLDTVRGERPSAFIKLLEPKQRKWFVKHMESEWVFRLKPGTAELSSDVIKVDGKTTISALPGGGARIVMDYVFVYAVNRPGERGTMIRLVAHKKGVIHVHRKGKVVLIIDDFSPKVVYGASCDFHDGFVHPAYRDQSREIQPPSKQIDPYDRTQKVDKESGCRFSAGT